ncbi:MAG: ribulokinase, partial [Clostridia bacterium]|nr:ribulokinase [Clostridia bacterium]
MAKYALGVDYGTLSARALIVNVANGDELASAVMNYPHGVMTDVLPDGTPLGKDWALQHPADYILCLETVVPQAISESGIDPNDIVGMSIDFTSSTVMPVDENNIPLCFSETYANRPHAYVMLWKHHAAAKYAQQMQAVAEARGESFLKRYGDLVSSEWMLPKLLQTCVEAPDIWNKAARFAEAGDWLTRRLTGVDCGSACMAGFKAFRGSDGAFPSREYFEAVRPEFADVVSEKLCPDYRAPGSRAGRLTAEAAAKLNLPIGLPVAVASVDAHVSFPAAGCIEDGAMFLIIGTSTCDVMIHSEERNVPGICGCVKDTVIPDYYGYEAGQSCCGEHFSWFIDNCLPASAVEEAARLGISPIQLMTDKAAALRPGQSGLVALDWWNGNRSVLVDPSLSGMILGLTLKTRPEEIYRALIEATAYGQRAIMDTFEENGVPVRKLFAGGGIAQKNPLLMQIYAD